MLRVGKTGRAVEKLQTMLIALGYDCGHAGVDGIFGQDTRAALMSFQAYHDLEIDGVYGPISKAALKAAYKARPAVGEPGSAAILEQGKYILSTGTHWISNNGSDENGGYSGGTAGDQTGKEWRLMGWYSYPWDCVLRHPDQAVAETLAILAVKAALNDQIGYDQGQRESYQKQLQAVGYDPAKIARPCEADCSAGVCANIKAVGHLLGNEALQGHTATYTGNMRRSLKEAGFRVLTDTLYLSSPDYLLPGDILLNEANHTATNVTVGSRVRGAWRPEPRQASTPAFRRYSLTEPQLRQIARLCQQEQGTIAGAKAEASLMANQLETSPSRQQRYGTGPDGLYQWVRNGGWFARAPYWMEKDGLDAQILEGVRDVLVNGNRTLPGYVDEHDCLSDIESISTGLVRDTTAYKRDVTVVSNIYGATWTFWGFPDAASDPFGYTKNAYDYWQTNNA